MQVKCQGLDLSLATAQVTKALPTRTSNQILEGIKLTAEGDVLTLTATDLELSIQKSIKAEVKIEGEVVLPGKFFSEFVKRLSNEEIELELDENNKLLIKYTDSESYIQCLNILEYPKISTVKNENYFTITQNNLKNLINKSIFSVAIDDSRPILKGCLLEIGNDSINAVALDGYRLALIKEKLINSTSNQSIIVPAKSLSEISKVLNETDEEVNIYIEKNLLLVEISQTKFITRLIEGEFINYKQIIPKEFNTNISLNRNVFAEALERTSILSRIDRNNLVKFDIKDKVLTLTSNSDIGNIKENIGISLKGNDLVIAFNSRYFTESMRVLNDEYIKISFNMPSSPCIITPNEGDEFLYLILPVRIIHQ